MIGYALAFPLDEVVRLVIILEQAEVALRLEGYPVLAGQVRDKADFYDGKIAILQAALRDAAADS